MKRPKKKKVREFAFWKYDLFPYTIGDEVKRKWRDGGKLLISTDRYGGMTVHPIAVMPLEEGQAVMSALNAMERSYAHAQRLLQIGAEAALPMFVRASRYRDAVNEVKAKKAAK